MAPDDEPKVKELLAGKPLAELVDDATKRELEAWFGLPSFEQIAAPPPPEDAETIELRERRARAVAAIDPQLLDALHQRVEVRPEKLLRFEVAIRTYRSDAPTALFDYEMAERGHMIAEPREVEIPDALRDDLKECTPQALLRDLHRAELEFTKQFDWVDPLAEQRFDLAAEITTAMSTSWKLQPIGKFPGTEGRELLDELRVYRRQSWPALWDATPLPNRRIAP
jgi:hypothetical protein